MFTNFRCWLILGCSLYDYGLGGSSQQWLLDLYEHMGFKMRRFVGWEADYYTPTALWSRVPNVQKKARLTYFNIPTSALAHNADNPFMHMKALAKPEDYVVFKLDVDAPTVELPLVQQILESKELQSLIDEFFWEHHVIKSPTTAFWAEDTFDTNRTMADSFRLFSQLRHLGIRAHSWV